MNEGLSEDQAEDAILKMLKILNIIYIFGYLYREMEVARGRQDGGLASWQTV